MSKKAHSKASVAHRFDDDYVMGKPASDRRKDAENKGSNVQCDEGSSFQYSGEFFKGGHTEARIVETIFQNSNGGKVSGTLTMKIDWQPSSGGSSNAPCEHCHALLCAAAKCGLDIYLCDSENKPQQLNKDDDCQDNLNMKDRDARAAMKEKNRQLAAKLDGPAI
jgi:hypothetical protein